MPAIRGIGEAALHAEDLQRSIRFYEDVLGFKRINHDGRFCAFRVTEEQTFLLFKRGGTLEPVELEGGVIPPHDGSGRLHLAFTIEPADFSDWEDRLRSKGVEIESKVNWGERAHSLYFRDPDGHLIELATPGVWNRE